MLTPLLFSSPSMAISTQSAPLILYAAVAASSARAVGLDQWHQQTGADRTSVFFNLMPIIAAILAAIILDETLAIYHYIGGSMVIMGRHASADKT